MIGDFMQVSGMGGQVLEKHMYSRHPGLPKWEQGYGSMGDSDSWRGRAPWWQTNQPRWNDQSLYSGMGQSVAPSSLSPGEYETAAQMVAQRQQWQLKGLGTEGAQGTWLSPSQVAPSGRGTVADLISHRQQFNGMGLGLDPIPHPTVLAAVKAARARRRQKARGMGDWMELSGITDVVKSPLGMLALGAAVYFYMQSKKK